MTVTVLLLGQARQIATTDRIEIEVPEDASIDQLLPGIIASAGEGVRAVLENEGKLRRSVLAILRDENVDPSKCGLLRDGDEVSLLPPMSGG